MDITGGCLCRDDMDLPGTELGLYQYQPARRCGAACTRELTWVNPKGVVPLQVA